MKPNKKKDPFNYGNYIISFREDRNGELHFLKKTINDIDTALQEAAYLNDVKMCHDVLIQTNN